MYWSKIKIFILLATIAIACNLNELEFDNLAIQDLNPTVVVPLGSASYSMQDLLEELNDDLLTTGSDEDQVVVLTYSDSVSYMAEEDFVKIDDVDGEGEISPGLQITATSSVIRIPIEKEFIYEYDATGEERLDSVFYDDGVVDLRVSSNCDCDLSYDFTIANTVNTTTGQPISFSGELKFAGNSLTTDRRLASLSNHKTVLNNNANNFTSLFRGEIILKPGQTLNAEDVFSFEFTYREQDFDRIFGFFGSDTVSLAGEEIDLDLFDEAITDGLIFEGPVINMEFDNKFGIPIGILTDSIYGKSATGDSVSLSGPVTSVPQIIDFNREDIYEGAKTSVTINSSNSNIRNLFNLPPDFLKFPITGISNVNNSDSFNYLTDSSRIDAKLNFIIPLKFRIDNYTQNLDFDIEDAFEIDEIDSLFIQVVTRNNLPFTGSIELAIIDADENELFNLPQEVIVELPTYNARGEAVRDSETITIFDLGTSGVESLKAGSKLSVRLILDSPGNNVNEFFSVLITDSISIEIGIGGKGVIEL